MKNRCSIPYCDESGDFGAAFANNSNPEEKSCMYLASSSSSLSCDRYQSMLDSNDSSLKYSECKHEDLVFDRSDVRTSLVEDYGYTCGYSFLRGILGASYMLGMLVGSFAIGFFSDKFGRLKALILSVVLVSVSGFIGAFMKTGGGFGFFRFLTGMGGIGCFMVAFVHSVEFVGARYTTLIGIAIEIPFAIGEMILGLEAYLIRDWKTLQMVAYAPLLALVVLWWLVPETPRWLLAAGKEDKAKEIIKKAAKVNGKSIPDHVLNTEDTDKTMNVDDDGAERRKITMADLFRPSSIALRTINMVFGIW